MKKIKVIYTGGTIGMVKSEKGSYVPFSVEHLMNHVPEVTQLGVDLTVTSFSKPIDSAFVGPEEWNEMAEDVFSNYDHFDGFVILHGTDTMAYTASALSYMLAGIDKPVVLTGSQIPISEPGTDGGDNFLNAIKIAKEGLMNEVTVWFHKSLFRAANVTKINTLDLDGFQSPNHPVLANLDKEIKYNKDVKLIEKHGFNLLMANEPLIKILDLSPGINLSAEANHIKNNDFQGVLLKTFGAGTTKIKEEDELFKVLMASSMPVLVISECLKGGVNISKYEAGSTLEKLQVIAGEKMTKEAALTKLIIGCSNFKGEELSLFIKENKVGEF